MNKDLQKSSRRFLDPLDDFFFNGQIDEHWKIPFVNPRFKLCLDTK